MEVAEVFFLPYCDIYLREMASWTRKKGRTWFLSIGKGMDWIVVY